ncbi:MAG: translocation/assembly module TamB domain-containing protein [Chlorobiota bacterium]
MQWMPCPWRHRLLHFFGGLLGTAVALGLGAFALLQLPEIRYWLLQQLLAYANRELNGELSLRDLRFRGFWVVDFSGLLLRDAAGDTVFFAPTVRVALEAPALTQRRLIIPTFTADSATLVLVRGRDSLWNVERLARPREKTSEPPDVSIWLRGIGLRNLRVTVVDSLQPPGAGLYAQGRWQLDIHELLGSAALSPRQQRGSLSIRSLRLRERLSGITIDDLHGHWSISPTQLRADEFRLRMPGLRLHLTARVDLSQSLSAARPGSPPPVEHFQAALTVDSLVPAQLAKFLPGLSTDFTDTVAAIVNCSGTLNELHCDRLVLRSRGFHVDAHLNATNPLDSARRQIRGSISSATVSIPMIARFLPELPPEARQLDFIRSRRVRFTATADSLWLAGQFQTSIGTAELNFSVRRWATPTPDYSLQMNTGSLSIGRLLPAPLSSLTIGGQIELQGRGTDMTTADARIRATLRSGSLQTLRLHQAQLSAHLSKGFLQLDTAECVLVGADTAKAQLGGWIQLTPPTAPSYRLQLALSRFPLATLLQDTALPSALSVAAQLSGQGLHPDSVEGFLRANIRELEYPEWSLLPFEVSLQLSRPSASVRFLQVTGDPFSAQLSGTWRMSTLPELAAALSTSALHWLAEQYRFMPGMTAWSPPPPLRLSDSADMRFRLELRDLSWLSQSADLPPLQGTLSLTGHLWVGADSASFHAERLLGRYLGIGSDTQRLHVAWLSATGIGATFRIVQGFPELFQMRGFVSLQGISTGELLVDSLSLSWELQKPQGQFALSLSLPNLLRGTWNAQLRWQGTGYSVTTTALSLTAVKTGFTWGIVHPFSLRLGSDGIAVDTLLLQRPPRERLRLYGIIAWDSVQFLAVELTNSSLSELFKLLPLGYIRPEMQGIRGQIDSVRLAVKGRFTAPYIELQARLRQLQYEASPLGDLNAAATLQDGVIQAQASLEAGQRRLSVAIASFPSREELFSRVPVHATATTHNLNAALLGPAVPELRNLRGSLNLELQVRGTLPNDLSFTGSLQGDSLSFSLAQTGIAYTASLSAHLRGQSIVIERCVLRNLPEDLSNGMLTLTGTIGLRQFRPWSFDLQLQSPQVLVLGYASARANIPVYGPLILATGQPPVQLVGTWESPRLVGALLLRSARLIFPEEALTMPVSPLPLLADYHWVTPPLAEEEEQPQPLSPPQEPGFAERLSYDLRLYVLGPFSITMDLAPTQQLLAELEAENPAIPLAYVTGPDGRPQLLGRLRLRPGSVYKFYRNFSASGTIAFTTGEIDNPELDVEVRYQGVRIFNNQRQTYEIRFTIRGTRRNLSIGNWSYTIAGTAGTGDDNKLFNDVLWLLLVGRTQEELEGGFTANGGIGREVPLANLSTIASKAATELFRGIGVVQDVQIDPTTGTFDIEQMRARITGQLGAITLRWGGYLTNPLSQGEFTVEMPLSELLRGEPGFLRQVLLQLSTTTGTTTVTLPSTQRLWEVRISVRL